MEISSFCIINENCAYTNVCEFENRFPDSVADYSSFKIDKETTTRCKEKRSWDTTIKYLGPKNIFIRVGIVWTLTIIVLTMCILIFLEIL